MPAPRPLPLALAVFLFTSMALLAEAQEAGTPSSAGAGDARLEEAQRKADEKIKATEDDLSSLKQKNERLAALAADPALKKEFAPFLATGDYQPTDVNFAQPKARGQGGEEGPISYRLLQQRGGTTDVKIFVAVATSTRDKKRPRWKKPTSKPEREEAEKRLQLFNDLAPTWVELKSLAP